MSRMYRQDRTHSDIPEPKFHVLGKGPAAPEVRAPQSVPEFLRLCQRKKLLDLMDMMAHDELPPELLDTELKGMTVKDFMKFVSGSLKDLRILAEQDHMTGLYNKRVLLETLESRLQGLRHGRRTSDNKPFAVLMTDIDHFKSFNDEYGHDVGDEVLTLVAQKLNDALRTAPGERDLAARYGGEEFGFILDGVDSNEAMCQVLDTLHGLEFPNKWRKITLSMGGAICTPETVSATTTPEDLLKAADVHLYHVKEGGRDGCSFTALNHPSTRLARHGSGSWSTITPQKEA